MDTTLYYTFSTIAQALAGAVALLGAFVLYKLQSIDRELNDAVDTISMPWQDDAVIQQFLAAGDLAAVVSEIGRRVAAPMTVGWAHYQQSRLRRAQQLVPLRAAVLAGVRPALWFPSGVMCAAVLVLSVVGPIAGCGQVAIGVLVFGVSAFVASMVIFVRAILRMLELR
jgi:hypothetical protein